MKPTDRGERPAGRFAYEGLERALHEKARLGILSSLVANPEGLAFSDLKELCSLTDGNLNRHIQVLQDAGLIEVRKEHHGRRPQTLVRLTGEGRERFLEYINLLEQIVSQTRDAAEGNAANKSARRRNTGWSPA